MLIAGEPSGDMLAAELVTAMRAEFERRGFTPRFVGAGGSHMRAAGVEFGFGLTKHSVIGVSDALKGYFKFRRFINQLVCLALAHRPDVIVCVDFSGFNRRFVRALRSLLGCRLLKTNSWKPKIAQYVSPQVWASRPGRAKSMARDYDLLLSIFPFEKAWYAQRVPKFRVEFVGHPIVDRHGKAESGKQKAEMTETPLLLLLPGSRISELNRHLPVMVAAVNRIRAVRNDARFGMVLPNEELKRLASTLVPLPPGIEVNVGDLAEALAESTAAIASTGTVTLECAYFGVPTVALYKTSWSTYQIGKRIVGVKYLAMPNLLANEEIFPEFIQDDATPEKIADAALDLLGNDTRRREIQTKLARVIESLGGPGAAARAARAVLSLLAPD
jgi:lipid-A-disaccharide synthase